MKMRCLAQEHGYTLGNVGVMIYRIDITLTDNSDETIAELQFPLIKRKQGEIIMIDRNELHAMKTAARFDEFGNTRFPTMAKSR